MRHPALTYTLGVMSGTSADGLDVACLAWEGGTPRWVAGATFPFSSEQRTMLLSVADADVVAFTEVMTLDMAWAHWASGAVQRFLTAHALSRETVFGVGSHGHTIAHYPEAPCGTTWQIGDPNVLAYQTGLPVVADCRRADMAAGGQGAPLAPLFHQVMCHNVEGASVVINLGGMANVTFTTAHGDDVLTSFDTGPGNVLLDGWCERHTGQRFDRDGRWAAGGSVLPELLEALRAHPFFQETPPKSTGREAFNMAWLDDVMTRMGRCTERPHQQQNVAATLVALTVGTIADAVQAACRKHADTMGSQPCVWVCGGGVHHRGLMDGLAAALGPWPVANTNQLGWDPDGVEAAAFAWLAYQRLLQRPLTTQPATGAHCPVVLGGVYRPASASSGQPMR